MIVGVNFTNTCTTFENKQTEGYIFRPRLSRSGRHNQMWGLGYESVADTVFY